MSTPDKDPEESSKDRFDEDKFNEEELIRSEFESMVSGLSLDESAPTTYLDDLDRVDYQGFKPPNPPALGIRGFWISAKNAVTGWMRRGYREDDGSSV